MELPPDVLAARYASPEMVALWSPTHRVVLERQLWVAVLRAQRDLGLEVPDGVIEAYEAAIEEVDLEAITERERVLRHDVKARIEEFCARAADHFGGPVEYIHRGMTSRDLTENVEQLQIRRALELIRDRAVATLARLADLADRYADLTVVARTHNVPAQLTTLGKRFANVGEELLIAVEQLEGLLDRYPLRGIKGPVGTQQDQLDLLGDPERVEQLERRIAAELGFDRTLTAVGQVYPRMLDLWVVATLTMLAAAPGDLATTIRLMAGHDLVSEGFADAQVGSSAMPHKINTRSCERVHALLAVLRGYLTTLSHLVGEQWNEGDVSDSAARRVAVPGAFMATDGIFETILTVLDEFEVFEEAVRAEVERELPLLATTRVLSACVAAGAGREQAHAAIREHALAAVANRRKGGALDLIDRLAADPRIPLDRDQLTSLLADIRPGTARQQVDRFRERVAALTARYPDAARYRPHPIL